MNFIIEGADSKTGKDRRVEVEADDEMTALRKAKASGIFPYQVQAIPSVAAHKPNLAGALPQAAGDVERGAPSSPVGSANEEWTQAMQRVNAGIDRPGDSDTPVRCPHCRSTQLTANKKGFALGNAAVGGLLLGPVGLLGGFIGSSKIKVTCLKCGKVFSPGDA